MGYTHYWKRPRNLDPKRFEAWTEDVRKILANLPNRNTQTNYYNNEDIFPIIIRGGEGTGEPEITPTQVVFNGDGESFINIPGKYGGKRDLAHETFSVECDFVNHHRETSDARGWWFDFCKTAQKPYDVAVTACLIRLAYHFPEGVDISSDGDAAEWEQARQLCEDLFGFALVPFEEVAA